MRYVNPHIQQPTIYPGQQQQPMIQGQTMQQTMLNPQTILQTTLNPQTILQTMQQNPQLGVQMIQQLMQQNPQLAMQLIQQMQMPHQQQHMMPVQQMLQYPQQYPQQYCQPNMSQSAVMPVGGRFTAGSQGMVPPQQFPTEDAGSGRYQTPIAREETVAEPASTKPKSFLIKPMTHKFPNNEKVKLATHVNEMKDVNIRYLDKCIASDCLEEIVEGLIEDVYREPDVRMVTATHFIVTNEFFRTSLRELISTLVSSDVKSLYKQIKKAYEDVNDKYSFNLLDSFNQILTDTVNDFIAVNAENSISIDSFLTDYNDLLKVIRNNEVDLEDDLIEYMDAYIADLYLNHGEQSSSENSTTITESYSIAYLDKHLLETGLETVDSSFVHVENENINVFITSLIDLVCTKLNKPEFLLVTLDKTIFKCMTNKKGQFFIRKFN